MDKNQQKQSEREKKSMNEKEGTLNTEIEKLSKVIEERN